MRDRMRAARVVADHPAQRGPGLGGRVGPEAQAVRRGGPLQVAQHDPRLDDGRAPGRIEIQDAVQVPGQMVVQRSRRLLHVLGLDEAADRMVVDYSHGMTKKVALAAALLHGPQVLFLDEPFEAIDPVSTRSIEAVLHRHVEDGGTVVFSSHVLDVVERLCDHVVVIDLGRIRTTGTIEQVRHGARLEDAFLELIGEQDQNTEGLSWLGSS